jgi:tetratricopeptide (TPR) repeat protein
MGDEQTMRYFHTTLAERELIDGRAEQAYEWLHPLLDLPDQPGTTAITLMRLAWFYLEQNNLDEASNVIAQAIARSRAEHCLSNLTECLWMQARIVMRRSCYDEAAEMLHEALMMARSTPYVPGEVRVLRLYAEVHLQQGNWQTAQVQLTEALTLCRRLGADRITTQIEQALTSLSQKQIGKIKIGTWTPVSDAAWTTIKRLLPPLRQSRGRPRADDRRTLDAILWVQQTGNAWSDLPPELGDEATAHRRWREWQAQGLWSQIVTILQSSTET